MIFIAIFSPIGWLAVEPPHDRGALDRGIAIVHPARASSNGVDDSWKNTTIAVRLNHDRGAIESRWYIFHHGIDSTIFRGIKWFAITISSRSWLDRGFFLKKKLELTHHRFVAELKPRSMPTESPPRRHQTASTTASIAHDFWANSPFKKPCISPLF